MTASKWAVGVQVAKKAVGKAQAKTISSRLLILPALPRII